MVRTPEFFSQVRAAFQFLEAEYGFRYAGNEEWREDPRDAYDAVSYIGDGVGVEVQLGICYMSVLLFEAPEGRRPESVMYFGNRHPMGIGLYDYVKCFYPTGVGEFLLGDQSDVTVSSCLRRGEVITCAMPEVVANLAGLLRKYGSQVLAGDVSSFPVVHAYREREQRP